MKKACLKLNIQKNIHKKILNIQVSSPTTSWHIDDGKVETVADFIFLGSKITMDLDCSHKIKTHLLLGRKKGYEKLAQCIKKQRLTLLQRSIVSQLWFFQ